MSAASWYNNPESAVSWYDEADPYFIRPEFGTGPAANAAEIAGGVIANELLGIDDFRRAFGRFGEGNIWGGLGSLATGLGEAGLTAFSIFGGPAGLATRYGTAAAIAAKPGGRAVPAALNALRNVYQRGSRVPVVGNILRRLRPRGRGLPLLIGLGASAIASMWDADTPTTEEEEDATTQAATDFVMNLPTGGGRGRAGVPSLNLSSIGDLMPLSDYQNALDYEVANIEARAGAYASALDVEWERVAAVNLAAVDKAERLGAAAGEEGYEAWDRAARGALDVTNTRNAALLQMAGGMPQAEGPGGAAEDFAQFAQAAGESERQLQQTLGESRAEDYRYMAQVAEQTGAGYQGAIMRAEQDATAAAVARHNQQVIARNQMVAQMQFQAALQQQQLAAQASIANAREGGAGSIEEVVGTAVALANRTGGNAGAILFRLFPDVFPTQADATAFIDSLGAPNPLID